MRIAANGLDEVRRNLVREGAYFALQERERCASP